MSAMSDDSPSRMIRVPNPLVDDVRELSRLHRQGRTKAVREGIQKLITAIDSDTVIDVDSVLETISKLTERLDRLEAQPSDSRSGIDIDSVTQAIPTASERLGKVENDLAAIALTIQDLSTRVSEVEGVGDIGYAVNSISKLETLFDSRSDIEMTTDLEDIGSDIAPVTEARESNDIATDSASTSESELPFDSRSDIEMTTDLEAIGSDIAPVTEAREPNNIATDSASTSELESPFDSRSDIEMTTDLEAIGSDIAPVTEARELNDITTDSVAIADGISPPQDLEREVLSQTALGKHLTNCSEKIVARQRKKGKESFALWSRDRDPDGKAWTWEGDGGRGEPYRYIRLE